MIEILPANGKNEFIANRQLWLQLKDEILSALKEIDKKEKGFTFDTRGCD